MRLKKLFFFLMILAQVACVEPAREAKNTGEAKYDRPWKLICLGGDWTIGTGLAPEQAYPALLAAQLSAMQPVKVVNAGIKGELVGGAADRVEWILQQRLDAIIIQYPGTGVQEAAQSAKEREDWQKLLRKIRQAYPDLPVFVTFVSTANRKEDFPQGLRPILEKFAARSLSIYIPDQHSAARYWEDNGVLLSAEGQKVLAEQLFSEVAPFLKTSPQ